MAGNYFKYGWSLTQVSAGKYQITGSNGAHYQVTDKPDSAGDNLTILGDIADDHFTQKLSGLGAGTLTGVYIGETADGQSFVGKDVTVTNAGYNNNYLYTNNSSYSIGNYVYINNNPFTLCYVVGTRIRTTDGEVQIEALKIGDKVVTASGAERPIKWIGRRSYSGRLAGRNRDVLPVCFKAGAIAENVPSRDLWVSPKHAMALDGVLIPAELLVNGVSVVRAERVETVHYFHVELDTHDILLAEGAPSESFVDDNGRDIFHNAREFRELYPNEEKREAVYCAPRVEDGYRLEAARRRLAERAGLPPPAAVAFGALRGCLDVFDAENIAGWAQDEAFPDAPVCLDVILDGGLAARVLAQRFRPDLLEAGIGDGQHGFVLCLPTPLAPDEPHVLEMRRSADGAILGTKALAAAVKAA